ncbi:ABC transporter substrate-binding protein [Paenibacillus senegalensis]|uniref:ABC transporter substrate-binding protein n=1 Tax=Paenibacillus senegalensis TaxID=1465766 RepID=UPI0002883B88|nr:ABC transporter substrate-binding protein [Paenibacillus senegalensis]
MKKITSILAAVMLVTFLAACGGNASPEGKTPEGGAAPAESKVTVNFGLMPYYDYAPWALAKNQGFFEEEGIEFKSTMFAVEGNVAPALVNGSIDIGGFGDTPSVTLAAQFEDLRMVSFNNIFKGFAIMSRADSDFKTYEEFLEELGDPKEAAIETGKQLQGKSVVTTSGATFYMVLEQALSNAGLSIEDMNVIDMEPDMGVSAFISGTGDFYLGGLPQRAKLEEEGFETLIAGEEIGAGAVSLAGLAATKSFVDNNEETIRKIQNVWFKTMDYMTSNPNEAYQFIADWSNEQTGGSGTAEEAKQFIEQNVIFATTPEEMQSLFYADDSEVNWKKRYDQLIEYHVEDGVIREGSVDPNNLVIAETLFKQFNP